MKYLDEIANGDYLTIKNLKNRMITKYYIEKRKSLL